MLVLQRVKDPDVDIVRPGAVFIDPDVPAVREVVRRSSRPGPELVEGPSWLVGGLFIAGLFNLPILPALSVQEKFIR